MTQDHDAATIAGIILIGKKSSPDNWLNAQQGKQIGVDHRALKPRGLTSACHNEVVGMIGGHTFEDTVLLAPISKVWIRRGAALLAACRIGLPDGHQLFSLREWQWAQKHCVYDTEDCGVRTNAQGERDRRDYAETRRLQEISYPVAHVLPECLHVFFPFNK